MYTCDEVRHWLKFITRNTRQIVCNVFIFFNVSPCFIHLQRKPNLCKCAFFSLLNPLITILDLSNLSDASTRKVNLSFSVLFIFFPFPSLAFSLFFLFFLGLSLQSSRSSQTQTLSPLSSALYPPRLLLPFARTIGDKYYLGLYQPKIHVCARGCMCVSKLSDNPNNVSIMNYSLRNWMLHHVHASQLPVNCAAGEWNKAN